MRYRVGGLIRVDRVIKDLCQRLLFASQHQAFEAERPAA